MKNAELLQRSGNGAIAFTKRKWTEITEQIQEKAVVGTLLGRTRGYFEWLNRNYIFLSLIQCALANLIAADRIKSADIFVFTRATEDLIDLLLMKSRAQSELTSMNTEMKKMNELATLWEVSKNRKVVQCEILKDDRSNGTMLSVNNLKYKRGSAMVSYVGNKVL